MRKAWVVVAMFAVVAVVGAAGAFGAATVLHLAAGDSQTVDCPNKISVEPVDPHAVALNCAADTTTTTTTTTVAPTTTTVAPTTTTVPPTTTTIPATTTAPTTTTVPPTTTTLPGLPDLVVTATTPSSANVGAQVIFSATIKNQGAPTTVGQIHDVAFLVDNNTVSWSDSSSAALANGATRVLTANSGPASAAYWVATAGTHTLTAVVNSVGRIAESSTANNSLATSLTVTNLVNVKSAPYNAVCDGTANDTTAVQAAANAATGKALYFPAGTCRVNTVNVPPGVNVTGDGPTSIVKQRTLASFNDPSPVFDAGGNNVFSNIAVDGNRVANRPDRWSDSYNDSGRGFKNSSCCGRGRGYRSGIRGESISGLMVDHVELTSIAGAAVATNMSSNVSVSNSNIHDTDFEAVYAFGDGAPVADVSGTNINVSNNTLNNIKSPNPANSAGVNPNGIVISRAIGGTVTGNTITNTDRDAVKLEGDQSFVVSGNTASAGTVGIDFPVIALQPYHDRHDLGSRHIRITDNRFAGPGHQAGVQVNSSNTTTLAAQDIEVDNNTLGGSLLYGVLMDGTIGLNQINVHNNTITGTSGAAIYVNGGGSNLAMNSNTHSGLAVANVNIPGSFSQSTFYN